MARPANRARKNGWAKRIGCIYGRFPSYINRAINKLKYEANCPIVFNKIANTYMYSRKGSLNICFKFEQLTDEEQKVLVGGMGRLHYFEDFFQALNK